MKKTLRALYILSIITLVTMSLEAIFNDSFQEAEKTSKVNKTREPSVFLLNN